MACDVYFGPMPIIMFIFHLFFVNNIKNIAPRCGFRDGVIVVLVDKWSEDGYWYCGKLVIYTKQLRKHVNNIDFNNIRIFS